MEVWLSVGAGELMLPDFRLDCFILITTINCIQEHFASSACRKEEEKREKYLYSSIKFI